MYIPYVERVSRQLEKVPGGMWRECLVCVSRLCGECLDCVWREHPICVNMCLTCVVSVQNVLRDCLDCGESIQTVYSECLYCVESFHTEWSESSNCMFRQFPDCVERIVHTDFGENVQTV